MQRAQVVSHIIISRKARCIAPLQIHTNDYHAGTVSRSAKNFLNAG